MAEKTLQLVLIVLLLPLGAGAQACRGARAVTTAELTKKSCSWQEPSYYPACQRLSTDASPYIFTAAVKKIVHHDGELLIDGECSKTSLQTVTLRRMDTFRGQVPEIITLEAGDLNGFYFSSQHRYLVFAYLRSDGKLAVDGYGHTRDMKDATEDLSYLRSFANRPSSGELFGHAYKTAANLDERRMSIPIEKPIAGAVITLSGRVQRQTRVDASGQYHFGDLPPGNYILELHSGPNVVWGSRRAVSVPPKGCARVDFTEFPFNPEIAQRSLIPDDLCPNQPH